MSHLLLIIILTSIIKKKTLACATLYHQLHSLSCKGLHDKVQNLIVIKLLWYDSQYVGISIWLPQLSFSQKKKPKQVQCTIHHIRCRKKLISICDPWAETTTAVRFEITGFNYNKPKTLQVIQSVKVKKYNRTKKNRHNTSSASTGSIYCLLS